MELSLSVFPASSPLSSQNALAWIEPTKQEESSNRTAAEKIEADGAWLARVQDGDEGAALALVERLYPTVVKCVRAHRPKRTSEEDLVQVVFTKIFRKLAQYSGRAPLEHWVSRIAINTCIKQTKHESIRPELRWADLSVEQERVLDQLAVTDENLPGEQKYAARELLDVLLGRLKPVDRLVITLLHLEEKSVQEVSELTGWTASRVKVTAFRARHKLHKLWKALSASELRRKEEWVQSA